MMKNATCKKLNEDYKSISDGNTSADADFLYIEARLKELKELEKSILIDIESIKDLNH